jgi:hypothetical protein
MMAGQSTSTLYLFGRDNRTFPISKPYYTDYAPYNRYLKAWGDSRRYLMLVLKASSSMKIQRKMNPWEMKILVTGGDGARITAIVSCWR